MSNPDKFSKNVRYRAATFGVIASAAQANVALITPDDAERRIVTGVQGTQAATLLGVNVQVLNAGYRVTDLDFATLAKLLDFSVLDEVYPPGIQINVNCVNNNAGATTGGDIIIIRYELPDHI